MNEQEIAIVAALADVDPRTVRRVVVDGGRPRAKKTREAIARALAERGHKAEARKVVTRA